MKNNPILMTDGYKTSHHKMYPEGTQEVYSNYTLRTVKRMHEKAKMINVVGIQLVINEIDEFWHNNFFKVDKNTVISEAKKYLDSYLSTDYDMSHFEELHDLGYLPIKIKSIDEGTIINDKIPILTIKNTIPKFYWLVNFLETYISSLIWKPIHSASLALAYKKILLDYAKNTDKNNLGFVDFQAHDFSFRGMQHPESAISSGIGFASCLSGSDTIPIMHTIDKVYDGTDIIFSVPASEHAVMTAYGKESEVDAYRRIIKQYPTGIVSIVSDTYDLWNVCTNTLQELKEDILSRDGKVVIRPDSGNPVDIVCGTEANMVKFSVDECPTEEIFLKFAEEHMDEYLRINTPKGEYGGDYTCDFIYSDMIYNLTYSPDWNRYDKQYYYIDNYGDKTPKINSISSVKSEHKGVVELLWDLFGGSINEQGYKVLNPKIGVIYGDSITLDICEEICARLKAKGFASTNVVFGVGSYSLGYSTRDSQGGAIKATSVVVNGERRDIFKDPITDDGTKKSAKGLIKVYRDENNLIKAKDSCTEEEENEGLLKVRYVDGLHFNLTTFSKIRENINTHLNS